MGFLDRFSKKPKPPDSGGEGPGADAGLDPRELVRRYHRATKHHPGHYARGPHGLDWETQPDPFRRYAGAELVELERSTTLDTPTFDALRTEAELPARAVDLETVSSLFRYSLSLSAWKVYGESRWSLRMNPSSGNLHPTEGYWISGPVEGLSSTAFVAHYAPEVHALEVRARLTDELWKELTEELPQACALVGLSSILWREEWKYGERAYRYCQHDVGHAVAALAYSAACLGWSVRLLDAPSSDQVARLLGTSLPLDEETEREEADCLLAIYPNAAPAAVGKLTSTAIEAFAGLPWQGVPNALSSDHLYWDAVQACAVAAEKPSTPETVAPPRLEVPIHGGREHAAHAIIAGRRSAVAMDGRTGMTRAAFYALLEACMPRRGRVPFETLPWRPRVHLLLFVHRVEDLEPGAYVLMRDEGGGDALRSQLTGDFEWATSEGCPAELPLFRLKSMNLRNFAVSVSCDQAIAGASAFSLGMLAEFDSSIEEGAWFYPRLYWECGAVGQALYLEGEAAGLRGTGIGCFFDDAVHRSFGLEDLAFQSLYHFTIGGPVEDTRLQSEPPY